MGLIWFVLALLAVDLAALLFAADTRPGFRHTGRWFQRHRATPGRTPLDRPGG
jgi:hypothetical protein